MNRIYKTVWNEALAAWVAVQETAKSHGKSASSGTGGGSTVVLDRLSIKKTQRFVPAVMVSALALAAGQANAGTSFYFNDGQDVNCTGIADSVGAVQYAIMGTTIDTPLHSVNGVFVPTSTFFGITPTYNPCKSVSGNGAEKRDTQTNRTLFYGDNNGAASATNNGSKNLTLGGRLDVNSGIIGVGDRGVNGSGGTDSIRIGTGETLSDNNKKRNTLAIGVDTKATVLDAVAIGAGAEASDPNGQGKITAVGYTAKATTAHATALGAFTEAKKDGSAAMGYGAKATGIGSVAVGRESYSGTDETTPGAAVANFTTAAGFQAKAIGYGAVSLGSGARATVKDAAALGHDAEASLENSVALGNGSSTKVNASAVTSATVGSITYSGFAGATNPAGVPTVAAGDQVSVGAAGAERQIKHVAPGAITAASTDAINGSQLFYVTQGLQNQIGAAKTHYYSVRGSGATDGNYNNDGATGTHALAAGVNASASAEHSVAVGSAAKARDKGTVALGNDAQATGRDALGIGTTTRANGMGATAIGNTAESTKHGVAIGNGAHAKATGGYSTAVGTGSQAMGEAAVALANDAEAGGRSSVAVGREANAGGDAAISIGESAAANAAQAIAMGREAKVAKNNNIAIGYKSSATGERAVVVGPNAIATADDATTIGSAATAKKLRSSAFGSNAKADGIDSSALGQGAEAKADSATAIGSKAIASQGSSTSIGTEAKVAAASGVAIGAGAKVEGAGQYGTAIGSGASVTHSKSVALGSSSTTENAVGTNTATVGNITYGGFAGTNPVATVSVGNGNEKRTITNVAAGRISATSTDAINGSQLFSVTQGLQTQIAAVSGSGHFYHVHGVATDGNYNNDGATGDKALAAGVGASAAGANSVSVGRNTKADTLNSISIGHGAQNTTNGVSSVIIGSNASATTTMQSTTPTNTMGQQIVVGEESQANSQSIAIGGQVKASGQASVAIGGDDLGNSEDGTILQGAPIEVLGVSNTQGFKGTEASGRGAVAIGHLSGASGKASVANGAVATATADGAIATGFKANAGGVGSIATGVGANSTAESAIAIGTKAQASAANSVALGSNSVADAVDNTGRNTATVGGITYGNFAAAAPSSMVSVGTQGGERTIANVAAGRISATSTDAINGSQLYATQAVIGNLASTTASHLGGTVSVGADGKLTVPVYNVAGNTYNNVGAALGALNSAITANKTHYYSVNSSQQAAGSNYANDGATGTDALAAGVKAQAAQRNSVAIGNEAKVVDSVANPSSGSIAIGDKAKAQGDLALALGAGATVSGESAAGGIAIGSAATSNNGGMAVGSGANAGNGTAMIPGVRLNNNVALGDSAKVKDDTNFNVALGSFSIAGESNLAAAPYKPTASSTIAGIAGAGVTLGEVSVGGDNTAGMGQVLYRRVTNVAAGAADTDAVNVSQLKAVAERTVTTPLTTDATGKVTPPATGNANKLATAGDIANAINNSGFQATAGGNLASGSTATATTVKPGQKVTFAAGNGLTVKQDLDANGDQSYTYAVNAQTVVQNAQTPVVYTKADGSKVYKHTDGKFYTQPNGAGTQVPAGDVIASMQNADGTTTSPTTLANVKAGVKDTDAVNVSQLKGAADALGGGAGVNTDGTFKAPSYTITKTDGTTYAAANNVGDALSNLNAEVIKPLTFAGDSGANVERKLGSTLNVKGGATGTLTDGNIGVVADAASNTLNLKLAQNIDLGSNGSVKTGATKMDNGGITIAAPTPGNPGNTVSLTSGGLNNGGNKITNVAAGTADTDAVNKGQLDALKENGFKISDGTNDDTVKLGETVKYTGDGNIITTVTDNQVGFKLANSITVGPATGGHPVKIDGNAGTVTGLTNKTWNPASITSGRAATEDQLKAAQAAATSKVTAGDGITVTPSVDNTTGSTTYKVAADTTPLAVGDGTGGNPVGKVIAPAAGNANKLATAGDIANAINNSGFNITAGGNTVGNAPVATTAKPGSTLTLKAGDGLTVKQDLDANGDQSYTYAVNAQTVVQNAQTPVVYTKADGSKVYKHTDGNFYTQPNGAGTQVPVGDVIASMQNAAGNTTAPTTLANVKGNLADTTAATTNPANNDRTTLTANGKGNNAATVNDVLNAGFTVQGNGVNKDFVTHGDTINFADGQGTVAKVTSAGGVTKVQFDTPMTYVDPAGAATSTPSNKVKLVGGNAGAPVTLDNVADGTVAANSKEAVNGGQLHDLKEKGFKIAADNGTPDTVKLTETVKYAGDSNIVTTVTDNQIGFKLANSITVGPATGGHPVTIDGNAGTVTGLTNKTWTPGSITSGRAATEDQLKAAVDDVSTVANKGWDIGNGAPAAVGTVKPGKKVDFVAGNGSTKVDVTQDATSGNSKVTVSAAPGALQYTSTNHAAGTNTPNADQFTPANQVTLVGPVGSTTGVTINNVAPAELSATSKQAVNGSQLYNTGSSTAAALGGTSSFDASTGKVTAGLNVGGTTHTSVQDALNAINTAAGAGWNLKANGGTASNIAPNGTVDVVNGSNTKVTLTGNTLKVDVVDNPTFSGPVTANGGLTVGGNLTVAPGANVNMGNNVIHNVADGVADTDAVNVRQLNAISGGINNVTKLVGENFTNPDGTKALDVYDVAKQTMTEHTSVISALNQVKREGTKYSHTRDNGEAPIIGPTNDSSAGALGSTAQGVNAIVEPDAVNATAMGHRARVRNAAAHSVAIGNEAVTGGASAVAIGDGAQALGKKSISIGTGNVVRGENSGAIGDPTIINAANSYSVGNNNTIAAGSHDAFVLGNNVTATAANSVHLGSGAAAQTAATPQTAGMTTYNVGIVNGVAYNYAGGTPTGVVTVGDVGQERRIQNVAAGQVSPTSTDAINGSQLYQTTMAINNGISTTINNLSNKIDANHNKAMGGVASAMASAGLPQAYVPGKSMVAMGAATYQGRTALALGVSTISDNGRWVLKGSVNTHNHGTVGANVGMGYQW